MSKKVVVIGAGISGLTPAYFLAKEGFEVIVLEKKREVGGSIETVREKGFLFDRGPNSGLETTPVLSKIVAELRLGDDLVYANKEGSKRYILRDNMLHPLPMNPAAFIKTKLFSGKAKVRLFAEPFIGRSKDGYYQSISDFVKRRLGQEFLDYAINPFVAGVYAGNPEELSVKSSFPKLYELEEKYGGLIVGTVKSIKERRQRAEKSKQSARMFSFKEGMQKLPAALAAWLGERVHTFCDVTSIEKTGDRYRIKYNNAGHPKEIDCDILISTVPAYIAAELFRTWDEKLTEHLGAVYYPPVLALMLGYNKESIRQALDGFGFLVPAKERRSFLGAIWSSVIFPDRADDDKAAFTLFVGGARDPEVGNIDKEILIKKVRAEFEKIMGITEEPVYTGYKYWAKAIPQYNLGYIEHERYFDDFENKNPGLFFSGNYRGGISIGDCLKNGELLADKIKTNTN
ncbi:MAG TPA: protoporphyrinogen oxidase [Ignavibacteriaceae bacterium]